MFNNSVIRRTGQLWKGTLFCTLFLLGVFTMFAGLVTLGGGEQIASFVLVIAGMTLAIISTVIALTTIRCPKCGVRWFWLAVKSQRAGTWLIWIMCQTRCPSPKDT